MTKIDAFNEHNLKTKHFGQLVTDLRKNLTLTQKEFGELIILSRATTVKIEQIEDVKELSDDLLFRLNHLTYRLMTNETFGDLVKVSAEKIYNITYFELTERITANINSPVLKLVIKD